MVSLGSVLAANEAKSGPSQDLPFGYVPTGWVGVIFLALFGATTLGHLIEASLFRTWFMIPTLVFCGVCELLGWAARYWGHLDPRSRDAFMMQTYTTIVAPSFMTAAILLILPQIVNELGPQYSRMPSRFYSILFIPADMLALLIQVAGVAIASTAKDLEGANNGRDIMLVGIATQLMAVVLCTILGLEFVVRFTLGCPVRPEAESRRHKYAGWDNASRGIMWMLVGLAFATLFVVIRSVYRTVGLSEGWNGAIASTEKWFNCFDGVPIGVAMFIFNLAHPGYFLRDVRAMVPLNMKSSKEDIELHGA